VVVLDALTEYKLDWLAFGVSLALTILLTVGTRETAWFNLAMNIMHIVLVVFIIIAGFVGGKAQNVQPFLPFGVSDDGGTCCHSEVWWLHCCHCGRG
jgi:APA family basic amino acid/polyamine antiporter